MAGNDWLIYQNQKATRNDPLDSRLVSAMSFLPDLGIQMHVISGGQEAAGEGGARTGSTRHDHGQAADADFYMNGRRLDWNNPADLPILTQIVQTAKSRGVTGIGAGNDYMGAGRFHVGFGNPGVWGAGGKGANAPDWLVAAYNGAAPGKVPEASGQPAWQPQGNQPNALAGPFNMGGPFPGAPQGSQQNALAQMQQPQLQWTDMRADPSMFMTTRRNSLAMG